MKLRFPTPARTHRAEFPRLTGGLNLERLGYRLRADQSPCMKNMWWQDGILQSRDGQLLISDGTDRGTGWACFSGLFHGYAFFHLGTGIYYGVPGEREISLEKLTGGVPEQEGTFFRYFDWLFYKNRGEFLKISFLPGQTPCFMAERMTELAYVPVIQLNSDPDYGSGDGYQPENRLSPRKTVWYNAKSGVRTYRLPVKNIDGVTGVTVDGTELTEDRSFRVDKAAGAVIFTSAPTVTDPPTPNTVRITYEKAEPDALKSVMDCSLAFVAGGDRNISILLAGAENQPNAVFWNANDDLSMNPGYFPVTTYNLVGATNDPVTGFGAQYRDTIVLKAHSLGKLDFRLDQVEGRSVPLFTYTPINDRVGCDLPHTIQLVENNLVFCNTHQGVHLLRSSSAAYENNVQCISRNVNGGGRAPADEKAIAGLLWDLRQGGRVTSFDDDTSYWLCANGHAYLWNYRVSSMDDPSWFYLTGVKPAAFLSTPEHRLLHMNEQGQISLFARVFRDYGGPIEKVYQFPVADFGSYDRLKDVTDVLFAIRSDTESQVEIRYDTDYESRTDRTSIPSRDWTFGRMNLAGRLLGGYNLEIPPYAKTARRRPGCRHIRHFTMTLSNAAAGQDLAIVSAQVFYRFVGKER